MRTLALLALLCLMTGTLAFKHRRSSFGGVFKRDSSDADSQPFQKNMEYRFVYKAQIASGLIAASLEDASDAQQKAVTRIQCQAKIQFASERHAQLSLQQCRVGQQNERMSEPEQVQPLNAFEPKSIPSQKQHQLEQPCQFSFADGVIERVQFHDNEETWSKNIKRAVLNMIQMNLKRNNAQGLRASEDRGDDEDPQQQSSQRDAQQAKQGKTFTIPEITLEGACKTTYTINPAQGVQQYNVTKTINFKQCSKIADVAYGFQTQQQQPQCAQCQQYWAQQQGGQDAQQNGESVPNARQQQQLLQNSEQHPCAKCDQKEVKEQELDRSTVIRCQIQGEPTGKYTLQRCELLSQYVYRNAKMESGKYGSAMETVVAATLQARGAQPNQQQIPALSSAKDESLMFSNEWDVDVKRFFMLGDAEFGPSGQQSPFHAVPNVQQAEQALRKLCQSMLQDKQKGIVEQQAPEQLQRLVEMLRMSTQPELKRIEQQSAQQQQQCKQIFTDALAMCGTRNCVAELAHKIKTKEMSQAKAVQALLTLDQLPAPSDNIVKLVEELCKSEAVHHQPAVKQSCWLTFGALVHELCSHKPQKNAQQCGEANCATQSGFYQQEQCPMDKKQQYKEAMLSVYQNSDCIYDKMVALGALGNAGCDICVGDLERIIKNPRESRVVRVKAIDALRRLRTQMPRKIQQILLPIFQNGREHAQVRTAAFAIMMYTQPEPQVVDQVMFTISKEANKQVQSFAYKTMKMMTKSQNPIEKRLAKHIQSALKLANVDEQELRASGKWEQALYSAAQQEGAFVSLAATISPRSALPMYAHVQLDKQLNDQFQINQFKAYMMQQEAEQWYQNVASKYARDYKQMFGTRAQRVSGAGRFEQNSDALRNIYNALGIKSRRSSAFGQQSQDDFNSNEYLQNNQPFAMFAIRTNDVDQGFLALDEHIMSEETRQLLGAGEKLSLAQLLQSQQKQLNGAMVTSLLEKEAKIPTSAGVPLRVLNSMQVLANIEGQAKVNTESASLQSPLGVQLDINAKASACLAHIQKMECWTPFTASGVQSIRAVKINAPLHGEVNMNINQGISIKLKLPQQQKTQLISAHTLPITYTATVDPKSQLVRETNQIRTIHDPKLERQQHEVHTIVGQKSVGMPLHIEGHYHWPAQPTSYQQFVQLFMATENAVRMTYQPEQDSPREAIFRVSGSHFQNAAQTEQPSELQNFYASDFASPYACEVEQCADGECDACDDFEQQQQLDAQEMQSQQERKQQLQQFIGAYKNQRKQYKHALKLSAQTNGGRKDAKAQCDIQAQCDSQLQYCKVQVNAERTPTASESQKWVLRSHAQLVLPETAPTAAQLQQQTRQNHNQFICQAQAEWGQQSAPKQKVSIRVQGTQAHTQQVRQIILQQQQGQRGQGLISAQQQRAFARRTAFLNKYLVEAQYTLKAQAQNAINRVLEMLKSCYFWNTKSQLTGTGAQQNGKVAASIVIDPITQQHANVTIKTPAQQVRLQQIELPTKLRPFALIRPQSARQTHSLGQLFSRFSVDSRAECTADGQRVDTFDDSDYPAPLSSNCYSVLAKDCSSEQPQFVVLMKKAPQQQQKSAQNAQKKLKVITPELEIECQPKHTGQRGAQPLSCKLNGQQVTASSDDQQTVQFNNAQQSDVTIQVEGIAVRFNGRKAWLKVAPGYKNAQCGLCGHYDDSDDQQDEWRMANGQIASNLAEFHRSYALKDTEECSQQQLDNFYSEKSDQQDSFFKQYNNYNSQEQDDQDEEDDDEQDNEDQEWQKEKFDGQFDSSEEDQDRDDDDDADNNPFNNIFGIGQNAKQCCCCCDDEDTQCQATCRETPKCRKQCREGKCCDGDNDDDAQCQQRKPQLQRQQQQKCCCCCEEGDEQCRATCKQSDQCRKKCDKGQCPDDDDEKCEGGQCQKQVSPVWKTKVQEQNHAVCFSTQPVKQCPRGAYPASRSASFTSDYASDDDNDEAEKQKKVSFVCMDRAEPQTRRLLRALSQGQRVVDVAGRGTSFTEQVREPQQCVRRRF